MKSPRTIAGTLTIVVCLSLTAATPAWTADVSKQATGQTNDQDNTSSVRVRELLDNWTAGESSAKENESPGDRNQNKLDSSSEILFRGITRSDSKKFRPDRFMALCLSDSGTSNSECVEIFKEEIPCATTIYDPETGDRIDNNTSCLAGPLNDPSSKDIKSVAATEFTKMEFAPAEVKFEPNLLGFGYKDQHTHMYAEVGKQTASKELLGLNIDIRAVPVSYEWQYGDGTSRTTYEPGEPLPDYDGRGNEINKMDFATETSHVYEETGVYPVTVTTKYTGQFRVDDEAWKALPGSVDVESSPGEADIWTQNSRWVSGACESQQQWGCNGPVQFDPATDRPPKIYQDQYDENGRWIGPVN